MVTAHNTCHIWNNENHGWSFKTNGDGIFSCWMKAVGDIRASTCGWYAPKAGFTVFKLASVCTHVLVLLAELTTVFPKQGDVFVRQ